MAHKKKLYSLLAILLSVTLLVTGIISALILWLAQRSTSNFENFLHREPSAGSFPLPYSPFPRMWSG